MQTHFSLAQLADPKIARADEILRACVHCGFCTATCPTFLLTGDELDSPRGRIYLIKTMLEEDRAADDETTYHVDRCLSCLSCMTTCPSGVHYMHLVDHARAHIEETRPRPLLDRLMRATLAKVLPYPGRFRLALAAAFFAKPLASVFKRFGASGRRMGAMLALAPGRVAARSRLMPGAVVPAPEKPSGRVALLTGCAQPVLRPSINEATVALLTRLGVEVVLPNGEGCCGALVHHLGREEESLEAARRNIDAWMREIDGGGLGAILITASGCGTTIKDYGAMLAHDPAYAAKAERVSKLALDISEYLARLDLPKKPAIAGLTIAYHSACSMQHGQKLKTGPRMLLQAAGYTVVEPAEGHICCGSAGTYNILQPELAAELRDRKLGHLAHTGASLIATGNIGCITQLSTGADVPVLHTVELLNWAYGGEAPEGLEIFGKLYKLP